MVKDDAEKEWLTPKEAADKIGCEAEAVRRNWKEWGLKSKRRGGGKRNKLRLFSRASVQEFIDGE